MHLHLHLQAQHILAVLLAVAGGVLGGSTHNGRATWFVTGLGSCGAWSNNADKIVALSPLNYAGGVHCFKKINIHYGGNTVTATVVDLCPSCGLNAIDLSMAAFQSLAPLDRGVLQVAWEYI